MLKIQNDKMKQNNRNITKNNRTHNCIPSGEPLDEVVSSWWWNMASRYRGFGVYQHESRDASHHDDVIKWKYFPRYGPFVWGIHRSPVNSLYKDQWRCFLLVSAWINDWVNIGEAGDLRRHRAHYDVIVMDCYPVASSLCHFLPELLVFLLSNTNSVHKVHISHNNIIQHTYVRP